MNQKLIRVILLALLVLAVGTTTASAGTPSGSRTGTPSGIPSRQPGNAAGKLQAPLTSAGTAFTYQGKLMDGGSPANGQYDLQFTLYDAPTGGNQVGSPVTVLSQLVSNGLFTVQLDFGTSAFQGSARWLEIGVRPGGTGGPFTTLTPRQPLTATPYAMSLVPGAVITDTRSSTLLTVNNLGTGSGLVGTSAGNVSSQGVYGESTGLNSNGVTGVANNGAASYGVWGQSNAGYGVYGQTSTGTGVYGGSNNGYGVSGVSYGNDAVHGDSSNWNGTVGVAHVTGKAGVYGTNDSNSGIGVLGNAPNGIGVEGDSTNYLGGRFTSNGNVGVWGQSNSWYGVYGQSTTGVAGYFSSTNGSALVGNTVGDDNNQGVYGGATGANSNGVTGVANNGSLAYGVWGKSTAGYGVVGQTTTGTGVDGESQASGKAGVYGTNGSNSGIGVIGNAPNGIGVEGDSTNYLGGRFTSNGNVGVWGQSNSWYGGYFTSTTGYGLYSTSVGNYAGFFQGPVRITGGCCSGPQLNTQIDDPLDPANKYLNQAAVESQDMLSVLNGNATTDAQGNATITLPAYFEATNRDFRYQLTIVGDQFAQVRVSSKLKDNHFSIQTDKPAIEVSWQVTGVRNDPYAQQHPVTAEQNKPANEKGYYLQPGLYGQPNSKSVDPNVRNPQSVPAPSQQPGKTGGK